MPFEIVRNNIIHMPVEVIVSPANPAVMIGSGIERRIYQHAQGNLLEQRRKIGPLSYGDTAMVEVQGFLAKYLIFAVSPPWKCGSVKEEQWLEKCYLDSFQLALDKGCTSMAIPLLSSGNQGFPIDVALQIALSAINQFLLKNDMKIYLVVFNHKVYQLSEKLFPSIKSYIDETYIQEELEFEYQEIANGVRERRYDRRDFPQVVSNEKFLMNSIVLEQRCDEEGTFEQLENLVNAMDETFSQSLIRIIDQKGLKDSDVYKKANIDRKLFSKIKNNKEYRPSKTTSIAFAIALELDLKQTNELIGKAGYTLSHSSKFDIIIEYFILHHNYDCYEINEALFSFGQPLIGS